MRAISAAAGVSVKTTEAAFGTKARLLKELIDTLVAGDDEPVAVADRPAMAALFAEPDPARTLARFADFAADVDLRLGALATVLDDAAHAAPELADLYVATQQSRLVAARALVDNVAAKAPLRIDAATAADEVWLLIDPRLYRLLTVERGWAHERFTAWLADTLQRTLLA
jgi:hypothetical protein